MNFDFELLLTLLALLTGLGWLLDACVFAPRRRLQMKKMPLWAEYARSFFPIFIIVLLLRSFLAEPYRIPSGSDEPTLLVGDFLVANKFIYGLRLPVLHTKIVPIGEPKTGDIILFRYPVDPSKDYIKRVIGVPGDHIRYIDKVLYINGRLIPQTLTGSAIDEDGDGQQWPVEVREETLNGIAHKIYIRPDRPAQDFDVTVPANEYFAMGDNRDDSNDSRYWGFVPEANLVGKAYALWFSWNSDKYSVRWKRIGTLIH
jgi:signal peptidase I